MKIDKVIMSCNDNPFYHEYWPIISKVWKIKFEIEPVLVFIGDASKMTQEFGTVIGVKKLDDAPEHTQAQWGRYWYTQMEPETIWLISDIDMMPLSRQYFIDSIVNLDQSIDPIVHFNTDGNSLPTCYTAGSGKARKESLDLVEDFSESIKKLRWSENDYNHAPAGETLKHWYAEENYAENKLKHWIEFFPERFFVVNRPNGFGSNRMDRGHNEMPVWNKEILKRGLYMDFHMPRPMSRFGEQINEVAECLLYG